MLSIEGNLKRIQHIAPRLGAVNKRHHYKHCTLTVLGTRDYRRYETRQEA